MASSNLENIFQSTIQAPTAEVVREEVILTKEANLENLIYSMVQYASYNHQLYAQAHLIHLNIETPIFISIHGFLKNQYEQHIEDFDTIGELIRSMDFLMPMCQFGLIDAYKKFKAVKSYEAQESLITYAKNLEEGGYMGKDLAKLAEEVDAPDVQNEIATILNHCFKSAWMLKATLRKAAIL